MRLNLEQVADVQVGRVAADAKTPVNIMPAARLADLRGEFTVELWRGGKRIDCRRFKNGIVNEGKNKLLNVMFGSHAKIDDWYIGLIDNAGFTALDNDDTYDDIDQAGNGWDEFKDYTDPGNGNSAVTRPEWSPDAASGQSITNGTVRQFDITGSGTVKGVFIVGGGVNSSDKGDHASDGTLWATALFSGGDVPVANSDQLKVTYTVSA